MKIKYKVAILGCDHDGRDLAAGLKSKGVKLEVLSEKRRRLEKIGDRVNIAIAPYGWTEASFL